jgi:hypothetical protein
MIYPCSAAAANDAAATNPVFASETMRSGAKERENRTIFTSGHRQLLCARTFPRPHLWISPVSFWKGPQTNPPATEQGPESHSDNGRQRKRSQLKTDLEFQIGF